MTQDKGKEAHRHPDAVAYLEGVGEEGASVVRPYEGGGAAALKHLPGRIDGTLLAPVCGS